MGVDNFCLELLASELRIIYELFFGKESFSYVKVILFWVQSTPFIATL